jgi:predicted AlkP superfamily pyrophosphatase or phosphodiesterase
MLMRPVFRTPLIAAFALALAGGCQSLKGSPPGSVVAQAPGTQEPPRLVVLMVVDQFPASLMAHLDEAFTGGLRRLRDAGFRYENATHDHSITETAPGHATISTGTEPAKHGIPANDWWETIDGQVRLVLNVEDVESPLLDSDEVPGASPAVLRRDGLADWMQEADDDTRIVSISGKDRGAVLLAAHSDAHAYWFDPTFGRFVTSRHYRRNYPGWVDDFNDDVLPTMLGDSVWRLEVPESLRHLAREDAFPWEGDGVHTTFPHTFSDQTAGDVFMSPWPWWSTTPALDDATLRLAELAIEHEDLGDDDTPDLLAVSLSASDRVGHGYGPGSLEQLDNLTRLDREIGAFIDMLDERFGEGGYLLAFTSDHGALELPEIRTAAGLPGVRLTTDSVASLQAVVDRVSGSAQGAEALAKGLAEGVTDVSWIERSWLQTELEAHPIEPDSFTQIQLNGYVAGRPSGLLSRAGIEMQMSEGVLSWAYPIGTGHGSPYHYDRHVPLIFFGAGIEPGTSAERVSVADVAPTLATLIGVEIPDDLDGVARTAR